MTQNVIKKTENFPSAGYTTFALMKNIKVIIEPFEGNTSNVGVRFGPDHNDPAYIPDYFAHYPLYLEEGYIFDGCGNSITVNQDSFMRNGVETFERGDNKYILWTKWYI